MRHLTLKSLFSSALLVAVTVALSCHDSVTLPPIKGPPLKIPDRRSGFLSSLAGESLQVLHISPKGQLAEPHAQIAVSFSKPMVELAKVEERAETSPIVFVGGPQVAGVQRWLGSRTLVFRPDKPLPGSTRFELKIAKGLRATDGSELEEDVTWSFTTPLLRVSRTHPREGERWIRPDTKVLVHFNQPVRPAALQPHASFVAVPHRGSGEAMTIAARVEQAKNNKQMVVQPATALPLDAQITLKVDKQLRGTEGPLSMGEPFRTTFHTYGPFTVERLSCTKDCDPEGSIHLKFSNPVPIRKARGAIRINGRAMKAGSGVYTSTTVYLEGKLDARRRYAVKVDGNLQDQFGQRLQPQAGDLAFTTGDFDALVHMPVQTGVLEAGGPKRLPIFFRNATKATLLSKRLSQAELAGLLGDDAYWVQDKLLLEARTGVRKQQLAVAQRPNVRITRRVDLGALVGGKGRGIVALELDTGLKFRREEERRIERAIVRITDLGLTAKYSPHSSVVWVTSLASGKPVAGCEVGIWRPGGTSPLWSGTTDAGGLAVGPGVHQLGSDREDRRFIFTASKGDDASYVLSSTQSGISPWDFGYDGTWEDRAASMLGMVFTDRGIYRPGEKVQIKGILRRKSPTGLKTPTGAQVKLTIADSRGEQLQRLTRKLSEFGSFHVAIALPVGAPLGSYSVVGKVAGGGTVYGRFQVEEYRPAEFKVAVSTDRKQYVRGDKMSFSAEAAYLFGAPMREAKHSYWVSWSESRFQPPAHEGYVFADEVRWWREGASRVGTVAQGEGKLDARGRTSKFIALRPPQMRGPRVVEVESTITDVSRQTISSRAQALLHPGAFYIGGKPKETFLAAGEDLEVEVVAVTPEGKRLANRTITGTLYRRTWHSVRKQGMGGAHYFVTEPVDTPVDQCQVVSGAKPKPCKLPVKQAGYYYFRLQGLDERQNPLSSTFAIYASGAGYVPWRRDSESRVELVTDRKKYKVGQVARILVKSPFAGAHGLFTVERNGILTRKPITLKQTSAWLEVPITKELVPNAYVSVTLVRGRVVARAGRGAEDEDPGRPTFKVGYAKLSIDQSSRELKVAVAPSRKEYRPGQEAVVDLTVQDAKGTPVKAELTVFVADEGVLSLIGYRTPDPMEIFYAERGLSVRTADNRIRLLSRRIFGEKGNNPGGGGGERGEGGQGGVRRNFVSTPYFNPSVITDANGRARISFKLPDNLTTFRVMAVATSSEAEFGHAQDQVKVNKPLLLLPTLPRLVRVDDQIEAGVVIHNHSKANGQVRVELETEGIEIVGPARKMVTVRHGGSAEARFSFRASAPGEAVFRFRAEIEGHRDALELRRPVKLPLVVESVAAHGSTESGVSEGLVPSSGIRDDVGGLEVAVSSTALVGLKTGVEYLMDYPYECVEQSTSRLIPLVMLDELNRAFSLKPPGEVDEIVDRLVAKVEKLQRWNGGFSYWPSAYGDHPWASAYAAWGLLKAKESGRKVSKQVLERAKGYLKSQLRKAEGDAQAVRRNRNLQAFVLYVLVDLGEKPSGYLSTLYDKRQDLAVFGKALLLSALVKVKGDQQMVDNLTDEVGNQVHQTAKLAKVEENLGDGYAPFFHSDLRSTAMVLEALLQSRPEHPLVEKMVRYLLEARRDGHWRNTQETVYALLGLHRYYSVREKEIPDFMAKVMLGQKTVTQKRFKGRTLKLEQEQVPMKRLVGFSGALGFIKQGTGRLYYSARLRYARTTLPDKPWDEGFFVTRTYEPVPQDVTSFAEMRGDPLDAGKGTTRVKAGDLVRVTLRVVVPQQSHFVAVDDPLPAGLEAVNFNLMTSSRSARQAAGALFGFAPSGSHRRHSSAWYSPFYHREIRDDRVQLFADAVPPGVHTYVYLARATTIGEFVAPPTHVEQMYEPERFGRTAAVRFTVAAK